MGSWHKRFNYLTILATLTLIVSYDFITNPFIDQPGHAGPMINPGPLSAKHEIFTDQQSCQNCHNNHNKKLLDWLLSAFKHQDLSSACTECHLFAGNPLAPIKMSLIITIPIPNNALNVYVAIPNTRENREI